MKKMIAFVVLILAAFSIYWFLLRTKDSKPAAEKQAPIAVRTHSDSFNIAVKNVLDAYYNMKDAFVEADTAVVKQHAQLFINRLDSIPLAELEKDKKAIFETVKMNIGELQTNATALRAQTDITEMRYDFRTISDMLYPGFFKTINYEGPTVYLQNCPMAFDGDKDANWISNSNEVVNPYLGKKDPKYKAGMLHCGEVKDSLVTGF